MSEDRGLRYIAGPSSHEHREHPSLHKSKEEAIRALMEIVDPDQDPPGFIQVSAWGKMEITPFSRVLIQQNPLEIVLRSLDGEYNSYGETTPTDEMLEMQERFIRDVMSVYQPVDYEVLKTWQEPFDPEKYGWPKAEES